MVTRAINLKVIVPRQADTNGSAAAIWSTHREVNLATRYYEELLLTLRQQPLIYRDGTEQDADEARQRAIELADNVRERNGKAPLTNYDDALKMFRQLYEAIVPSSIGEKGTAKDANRFCSPLLDPDSQGLLLIFDSIQNPPNWIKGVRDGLAEEFDAAYAWLENTQGKERLKLKGRPPKWKVEARNNNKAWPEYFVEDYDEKLKEAEGLPTLIRDMRGMGLLPLAQPYFATRLTDNTAAVTPWDRLSIRLAVAHLLGWEKQVKDTAQEHEKRVKNVETFKSKHASEAIMDKINALRAYESERLIEIAANSKELGEAPTFSINKRMVRGWPDLRKKWLAHASADEATLLGEIATEQSKKRGKFGDPHLYRWLAKDGHHTIWNEASEDPVEFLANLNAIEGLVERSRKTATMTLPDARQHPRSAQWEPKGGENLRLFELWTDPTGNLQLSLPLVTPGENGSLIEVELAFALAASKQLQVPKLRREGEKKAIIEYRQSSGELVRAILLSADLMLKWSHVRNREEEVVERGDIGPVYLKLALDLEIQEDPTAKFLKSNAIYHFQTAAGKKTKQAELIAPGMRVLSVDLGLRSFATCSVFELKEKVDRDAMFFPVKELALHAVHERSFTLKLPDEDVGRRGRRWQADAANELREMRRALGRHRSLRRLNTFETPEERGAAFTELQERTEDGGWAFEEGLLEGLKTALTAPHPVWVDRVNETARGWRLATGPIVSDWRKRQRNKDLRKFMGKSIWSLDYLNDSRKFLLSWSLLGRDEGDIRRLDREKSGVFAGNLLDHLAGVKADRIKTGADLLVQSSRGFTRSKNGTWEQTHKPCQFILFEDLSRYRMRTDRPKRENSQLMKWAHRKILDETEMQAELYGMSVVDTGAAFSSRYYAMSSAPGMRAATVTKQDLENQFFLENIARENPHIDMAKLKAGDLVLRKGGEDFVTLRKGELRRLQADVNAAQNLQRRLWTRHSEAIRLVTKLVKIEGVEHWVPSRMGDRIKGAMDGFGYLVPTGHASGSCEWKPLTSAAYRKLAGGAEEELFDDDEIAGLAEEALERSGQVTVFFRDPSSEILPANLWYPSISFWSITRQRIAKEIAQS